MSTRRKLVLLLFASLFGIILIFSAFIYYNILEYSYEDFHSRLHARAITTAKIELDLDNDTDNLKQFKAEYLEKLSNENHYIFRVDTLNISSVAHSLSLPNTFFEQTITVGENYYKDNDTFYNAITYQNGNGKYLVIVSAENYYHTHHDVYLQQLMVGTILFSFLLIFFLSYWMSNQITKPLNIITDHVNRIGTENLHLRIPEDLQSEELKLLSKSFNVMLDRLQTAFEAQNNFVSNASHELRTPLTTIIGEADLALSRDRNIESYKDTLRVILVQAEKLNNKTKALLGLAQTGFQKSKLSFENLRIDEILIHCKETLNTIDPHNNIQIDFSNLPENHEKLQIQGNRQLLVLALTNIMGNGLKYSKNEIVNVSLEWTNHQIIIKIQDRGIGIPETELPYIFDPFFRASNTEDFEGYGIGLPLARNIIRLHKGELQIFSAKNAGVRAEIKIPLRQG